jgi:hypothetical protein
MLSSSPAATSGTVAWTSWWEGDAVQVTDPAVLGRLAAAWAPKWDGRWRLTVGDGGFRHGDSNDVSSEVFSVVPTTIYAHAKGDPFGQTTHRF